MGEQSTELDDTFLGTVGAEAEGVLIHVDGVVVEADRAFARIFGFGDSASVVGANIFELLGEHSRASVLFECVRSDGSAMVIETRGSDIEFQGQHARMTRVRDVTERQTRSLELREATERFRLAFEGAPIGIALVGADGRWLQVNPALCAIVGYSADELLTKTFQDITHPDDLETDLAQMYQVLAGEIQSYSMEKRYFHADGHVVWVNLSVSLVRDPAGAPLYFISQIEDVSERRRAAAELAAAEKRFRTVVEFAPEAMIIVDADGVIRMVNRRTEELFGYARDELHGRPVEKLVPAPLRDDHVRHRSEYRLDPRVRQMGAELELRGLHRDGAEFPIEVIVSPLADEQDVLFSASVRDITQRKRVEAALRRESETVRLLERVAVAANAASSVDEVYATTLHELCAYTGWPVGHVDLVADGEPRRLVSSGIWHMEDPARFEPFRRVKEATPQPLGMGVAGSVLATGRAIWAEGPRRSTHESALVAWSLGLSAGFAFPVLAGDEVVAVFEFFDTVATEPNPPLLEVVANVGTQLGRVVERVRHQEQQQQLDAARARFVANAAHELRTPLATLRAVAGLLGARRADMTAAELERCFDMMERQGENLETLVADLLDLSELEHGANEPTRTVVPVGDWVAAALDRAPAPENVTVESRVEPGLCVHANADRLARVLVNLLTNAYRYGGSSVVVSAHGLGTDAVLAVDDDGPGVPERIVGHLFEPFTRGAEHSEGGAGLGLAISRRIVEQLGGDLTYAAIPGGGARFVVRLPTAP